MSEVKTRYMNPARPALLEGSSGSCRVAVSPAIRWHTADAITRPSEAAMNANASNCLKFLAKPKPSRCSAATRCGDDLSSPITPVCQATLCATASPRTEELATPRGIHKDHIPDCPKMHAYSIGRSSEIWKVSAGAKSTNPACWPRSQTLATPHRPTKGHDFPRHAETYVSEAATKAHPSDRTQELSVPKPDFSGEPRTWTSFGRPSAITLVTPGTQIATASEHTQELAKYRRLPEDVRVEMPAQRPVSLAARTAKPSQRIKELAMPIERPNANY